MAACRDNQAAQFRPCRQLAQAFRVDVVSALRKLQKHAASAWPRQRLCALMLLLKQAACAWPQLAGQLAEVFEV